jgi:hypothetical protein
VKKSGVKACGQISLHSIVLIYGYTCRYKINSTGVSIYQDDAKLLIYLIEASLIWTTVNKKIKEIVKRCLYMLQNSSRIE